MTDAELALLSLLINAPQSDDALHAQIDAQGLRRWTAIGIVSMYYVLEKLEKQGLIRSVPERLPVRVWAITPAGASVLQTAVLDLLGTPHPYARSFELGLANLHILKTSQVRAALQNYQQELSVRIRHAQHEQAREQAGKAAFQAGALYSHALAMLEAEQRWLETFTADWEAQAVEDVLPPPENHPPIPRIQQVVLPQDEDSVHKRTTIEADFRRTTPRPRPPTSNP